MNLTTLTLLQGRLYDIAVECEAQLQRVRDRAVPEGEQGPEWFDASQRSQAALVEFFERRLSMALRALDRIDEGRFGLCERCGKQIDRVQLFVDPDRLRCAGCSALQGEQAADALAFEAPARSVEVVLRHA
jgi:RNA polymerase-binding transcription factor DksA